MIWPMLPDDYPYDDGFRDRPPRPEERLRHVVFLDGLLVDTWMEQVEGTVYWVRAQELDRAALPRSCPPETPTPPHERVLDWLDSVVGGRAALLSLDDRPLEPEELPEGHGERLAEVVALLDRLSRDYFDDEFQTALSAALASLSRIDPVGLNGPPGEVAGALCWMVGRANARVGAGTAVTQQVLKRELWVKTGISPRATKFKGRLRELLPSPMFRPPGCPNLLELGSPAYLTSATRRDLIELRDRALAVASAAAADEQARHR